MSWSTSMAKLVISWSSWVRAGQPAWPSCHKLVCLGMSRSHHVKLGAGLNWPTSYQLELFYFQQGWRKLIVENIRIDGIKLRKQNMCRFNWSPIHIIVIPVIPASTKHCGATLWCDGNESSLWKCFYSIASVFYTSNHNSPATLHISPDHASVSFNYFLQENVLDVFVTWQYLKKPTVFFFFFFFYNFPQPQKNKKLPGESKMFTWPRVEGQLGQPPKTVTSSRTSGCTSCPSGSPAPPPPQWLSQCTSSSVAVLVHLLPSGSPSAPPHQWLS